MDLLRYSCRLLNAEKWRQIAFGDKNDENDALSNDAAFARLLFDQRHARMQQLVQLQRDLADVEVELETVNKENIGTLQAVSVACN